MTDGKADFVKFVKYFTSRLVQTLVQARLGEHVDKICTAVPDHNDWFNLKIDEIGEVSAYLKSTITKFPPYSPVVIEFILYTADGQHLPLEAWILTVNSDKGKDVNVRTELYHQMSTLLRSVALAARMTPMHRQYVKKQSEDSFIVLYRLYDSTVTSNMGKDSKKRRLGELPTPFGTLCLDLVFRTSMLIDENEENFLAKSNSEEYTGALIQANDAGVPSRPSLSDCLPVQKEDEKGKRFQQSNERRNVCFCNFSRGGIGSRAQLRLVFRLGVSTSSDDSNISEHPVLTIDNKTRAKLALLRNHSFPLSSLLQSAYEIPKKQCSMLALNLVRAAEELEEKPKDSLLAIEDQKSDEADDEMDGSQDDSFVKICGFGSSSSLGNDLAELIKHLKTAPETLSTCAHYHGTCEDIQKELSQFDAQKKEFDNFVVGVRRLSEED
ncbi:unnamed protein product [Caenorhabditis auriculariae]|uniref:Autophagy-related protein 13 n=1 Tax=Caenorhabditis auriculariae TaxID=2777116 RepID=A0A8S1GVW7_9PELO|nr:unnamed protein product [Caenorhabditis auriculariae]